MKKRIVLLIVLFGGLAQLFGQTPKSSLLWQISGKGLQSPSYLFGTFHIMCKEDFTISETLKSKIRGSKQFFGELKMDDPQLQMQMAMSMIMKDKTIESMMPADEYKEMSDAFLKVTRMPFTLFNRMKPFMSESLVAINLIECDDKVQPETEFMNLAKESGIPVLGLETVQIQLAVIDKTPLDSQVLSLKETLLNLDSSRTEMKKMISLYKKRNVDALYSYVSKSAKNDRFETDLITVRNKNWVPVIEKAVKEKASFFAVGAGHLGGPQGVLALLRRKGYTVTPVKY